MTEREFAIDVVQQLQSVGYEALWAGGCVRDELLGLTPKDYDIATSASPEQVRKLFRRTIAVGISFGVVQVLGPKQSSKPLQLEVATFRSDVSYSDGRHPDAVVYSTAKEDAQRRDFTINGMFKDPLTETIIDYVGGQQDLQGRILRAIGNPLERFTEDKLRMLRAVRMATRFDLTINSATFDAIAQMANEIDVVSAERIADELRKTLILPRRTQGIRTLQELGLLTAILPEVKTVHENALNLLKLDAEFPLTFAILLLDVEHVHELCQRLKLSNEERVHIVWLVEHKAALNSASELPLCDLKRLLIHPGIRDLLELHRVLAQAEGQDIEHVEFCEQRLREWTVDDLNPEPLITGHDLMELGLTPGPQFKQLLTQVRDAQLNEEISTKVEALKVIKY